MDRSVVEILSRIDKSVAEIVKSMQPQNQSSSDGVAKLSKGDTASGADPNQEIKPTSISTASIGDVVKVLNNLSPAVKLVAKLDGQTLKSFNKVIEGIVKSVSRLADYAKKNDEALKSVNQMSLVLGAMGNAMLKMPLFIVIAPLALIGLGLAIPVILLYGKVLSWIGKMNIGEEGRKNLQAMSDSMKPILSFMFGATLVVAACIGLGAIIKAGGAELILYGLGTLGAVLLTVTALILLTGFASKLIKEVGAFQGVKDILLLTLGATLLVAVCIGLGAILMNGETSKLVIGGLIALGGVLITLGVMILLVGLLSRVIKGTGAMAGIRDVLLMTLGAMLIIVASKFLGDFVNANSESIMVGLEATGAVLISLVGIGWLAGKLLKKAKKGITALAVVELVALGAMGIMLAASKLSEEINGKGEDIALTIAGCEGIIIAFGALAFAVSYIAPEVMLGSAALGVTELMALGSIALMSALLKFHQTKEDSGVEWESIGKDVLGMEAVMGSFGLLAAAFGLLIVPIGAAMPGMYAVSKFAHSTIGITKDVIAIHDAIEKAGGAKVLEDTVGKDIAGILKQFNSKNLKVDMSLIEIGALAVKFAALDKLTREFADVAVSLSRIAKVAGIIDDSGKISPVLFVDKQTGEIKYGEPVDIKATASLITDTVRTFVDGCNYGFDDIKKMFKAAVIFEIIGEIVNPISSFVNVLTGFTGGKDAYGNDTLAPVSIDAEGKIQIGQPVDIKNVAGIIAGAVTSFVNELYKDENTGKWVEMVFGGSDLIDKLFSGGKNEKTQAIEAAMGVLGVLVTPVSQFVEMITGIASSDGKSLSKIIIDSNGNAKPGQPVDVVKVSTAIVSAIDAFVTAVYDPTKIDAWVKLGSHGDKFFKSITDGMESFAKIAERYSSKSKISSTQISSNVVGINALITTFSPDNFKVNITAITASIDPLNKFAGVMAYFSDSKKINANTLTQNSRAITRFLNTTINKDVKSTIPTLDKFSKSLTKTTSALKGIDKVLNEDKENRKKAIDEFRDSIEELLKKFSGADDSISKLYNLIMALQTMDADRVSNIISSLNINNHKVITTQSVSQPGASDNRGGSFSPMMASVTNNNGFGLTVDDIKAALVAAFDGATLNREYNDNLGFPKKATYTFDVNN